ncbi:MAG TPA: sensor histidine kinase [Bacillaceae bacterium]
MMRSPGFITAYMARSGTGSVLLAALLTAVASEIKVIPFNGEGLRFGLGSITFFLLILIHPPKSYVRAGVITGLTVVFFRMAEDLLFGNFAIWTSFTHHAPAFLFYCLFSFGLGKVQIERYKTFPLLLGAWAAIVELIANSAEHLMRHWLLIHENLGIQEWLLLFGVALIRSYFAVGLYSSVTVAEQKKRVQELTEIGAELYAETLYLQKSMNHIEQITASSHDLYRKLKKHDLEVLSTQALHVAQEIHEVKKDSQRILSGLLRITDYSKKDDFLLSELAAMVTAANERYSAMLNKTLKFHYEVLVDFKTDQYIPLLALLNNLASNAVEAMEDSGEITLTIKEEASYICFLVEDTGKGIPQEDMPLIFEPGYTTKYNDKGVAATGIGLSHVQEIIQKLEGEIHVDSSSGGTQFLIKIPSKNVRKREL